MSSLTFPDLALMSTGLLAGRLVLGLLLAGHGAQKLFGWFGGHGLAGTGAFFESLGFRPGRAFAAAAALSELGGGLLIALGFLGPVGPALIVAVMIVAALTVHWGHGDLRGLQRDRDAPAVRHRRTRARAHRPRRLLARRTPRSGIAVDAGGGVDRHWIGHPRRDREPSVAALPRSCVTRRPAPRARARGAVAAGPAAHRRPESGSDSGGRAVRCRHAPQLASSRRIHDVRRAGTARCRLRGRLLGRGSNHRDRLPSDLSGTEAAPAKRRVLPPPGRRIGGRLPAVRALPAAAPRR